MKLCGAIRHNLLLYDKRNGNNIIQSLIDDIGTSQGLPKCAFHRDKSFCSRIRYKYLSSDQLNLRFILLCVLDIMKIVVVLAIKSNLVVEAKKSTPHDGDFVKTNNTSCGKVNIYNSF